MMKTETLKLTQEWDKPYSRDERVDHCKMTFVNRYGITLAADQFIPKNDAGALPAIAVSGPFGEDFQAAVDFLYVHEKVNPERIGIIGVCGWGGMALNAAAIDTRVKATVTSTMYDMDRVSANGYFDSEDSEEARYEKKAAMNTQRTEDYRNGMYQLARRAARSGPVERERSRPYLSPVSYEIAAHRVNRQTGTPSALRQDGSISR